MAPKNKKRVPRYWTCKKLGHTTAKWWFKHSELRPKGGPAASHQQKGTKIGVIDLDDSGIDTQPAGSAQAASEERLALIGMPFEARQLIWKATEQAQKELKIMICGCDGKDGLPCHAAFEGHRPTLCHHLSHHPSSSSVTKFARKPWPRWAIEGLYISVHSIV
jgi:hypothetical protein